MSLIAALSSLVRQARYVEVGNLDPFSRVQALTVLLSSVLGSAGDWFPWPPQGMAASRGCAAVWAGCVRNFSRRQPFKNQSWILSQVVFFISSSTSRTLVYTTVVHVYGTLL